MHPASDTEGMRIQNEWEVVEQEDVVDVKTFECVDARMNWMDWIGLEWDGMEWNGNINGMEDVSWKS